MRHPFNASQHRVTRGIRDNVGCSQQVKKGRLTISHSEPSDRCSKQHNLFKASAVTFTLGMISLRSRGRVPFASRTQTRGLVATQPSPVYSTMATVSCTVLECKPIKSMSIDPVGQSDSIHQTGERVMGCANRSICRVRKMLACPMRGYPNVVLAPPCVPAPSSHIA